MIIESKKYRVHFVLEDFTDWMKSRGIEDGEVSYQQEIIVDDVELENGYLVVTGEFHTHQDA